MFEAEDLAVKLIFAMRGVVEVIERRDRGLGDQLRRAATSIASNLSEGRRRVGRDRFHCWRIAAGSAAETRTQLQIAVGWGYVGEDATEKPLAILDRLLAMCWRLTNKR